MASTLVLTGDVNLMNVADPEVPFRKIAGDLRAADVVFSNLECCLHLPSSDRATFTEGFFADPAVGGEALRLAGIHAVGIANNVNYGAANIMASVERWRSWELRTPVPGAIAQPHAPLPSSPATACAWGSCNAAPSIGRPTTRRMTIHLALP